MKYKSLVIPMLLAFSSAAFSAEIYDQSKSYSGGERVSFNGAIYEAQWWVNPNQSPADVTGNSWESPWILISETGGETTPPPADPEEPSEPTPPVVPPIEGDYPAYVEGEDYVAGDIVINTGKLYRCKDGITQTWCSGPAWAYAPGTGTAWDQAWEEVADGTPPSDPEPSDPEVTPDPDPTPDPAPEPDPSPDPSPDPEPTPEPEPSPEPEDGYVVYQEDLDAKEAELTNFPAMASVKDLIRTIDNATVNAIKPLAESNPDNVKRIESIISEADWEYLFPERTPEYTYRHFLQATGKFPAFCDTYEDGRDSDAICRKALATMFAHFTQETGGHTADWPVPEWRQGLVHVREMGWDETMRGGYNGECNPDVWQGQTWPCGTFENGEFKSYFGRGAKQLSYNYNYGPFSEAMFGTVRTLLDNPEMVADTWLNFASAVFFFTYPQPPKPAMMHVIDGTWQPNDRDLANGLTPGFGVTTQIINGGVECGGSVEIAQSLNRIDYYKNFTQYLQVPVADDEVLGCKEMKQFDTDGAGALSIYWEKDWGWSSETPTGGTYSCQMVGYQTPFSAFKEGDFTKCVVANFPDVIVK
ncbi:glycoside hydrolase family 19 protein [Vibrio neonatus]|uniref:glycoside hydrolase family 19 protein n=1 Tax=Vibrio neonatus TaxID=278860 RepID=UPI0021C44BC0|nr:glycoside hydrolase family 19 protein [Vibrio neonatus]